MSFADISVTCGLIFFIMFYLCGGSTIWVIVGEIGRDIRSHTCEVIVYTDKFDIHAFLDPPPYPLTAGAAYLRVFIFY